MQSFESGKAILENATIIKRHDVVARLNTKPDPTDTVSADIYHHKSCSTELYTKARSIKRLDEKSGKEFKYPSWLEPSLFDRFANCTKSADKPIRISVLIKQYPKKLADSSMDTSDLYIHSTRFKTELLKKLETLGEQFSVFSDGLQHCLQEEADTRIFKHLEFAVNQGHSIAKVRTVDTDVVVIAVGIFYIPGLRIVDRLWNW